jgi:hypothetical protein
MLIRIVIVFGGPARACHPGEAMQASVDARRHNEVDFSAAPDAMRD